MSEIQKAVEHLLHRTGIGKQLLEEAEAERAERFDALRQRKAAAIAKYLENKPRLDKAVAAAEAEQRAAQKAAEDALQAYMRARDAQSTNHDTLYATVGPLEEEMRRCCSPAIDEFLRELDQLQEGSAQLRRDIPDPTGPLQRPNSKERFRTNAAEIERRVRAILELKDAAHRLKTSADVTDVAAEIDRLRNTIPGA